MQFNSNLSIWRKWASKLKVHFWLKRYCRKFILTSAFICLLFSFLFQQKSYEDIYHSPQHVSVITGNILIMIIRFASYDLLLASSSAFMTDFVYLGTTQICWNLNEHNYYSISTTSVIWQIDAGCSPFRSLLPFHIRLELLKLIC